jgi:putative flippase GtrA
MSDIAPAPKTSHGWRQTQRQLFLYGLIGGIQLVADWLSFVLLTWAGMDVVPANLIGRLVGACLGFWLNGRHTFASSAGKPALSGRHAFRFVLAWILTALISTAAVWLADHLAGLGWARASKLFIDAMLAVLGFLLSKYWIFR